MIPTEIYLPGLCVTEHMLVLRLNNASEINVEKWMDVFQKIIPLQIQTFHLYFHDRSYLEIHNYFFDRLFDKMVNIESLVLDSCEIASPDDFVKAFKNFTKLKHLKFHVNREQYVEHGGDAIIPVLTQLESLSIADQLLSRRVLEYMSKQFRKCHALRDLCLVDLCFSDAFYLDVRIFIRSIAEIPLLHVLTLSDPGIRNVRMVDEMVSVVPSLKQLTWLELRAARIRSDEFLTCIRHVKELLYLEYLSMHYIDEIHEDDIDDILDHLKGHRALNHVIIVSQNETVGFEHQVSKIYLQIGVNVCSRSQVFTSICHAHTVRMHPLISLLPIELWRKLKDYLPLML